MKISTEDFTDETLAIDDLVVKFLTNTSGLVINDTYGSCAREIVVLIMEVDKVVDEVTDMEIDK